MTCGFEKGGPDVPSSRFSYRARRSRPPRYRLSANALIVRTIPRIRRGRGENWLSFLTRARRTASYRRPYWKSFVRLTRLGALGLRTLVRFIGIEHQWRFRMPCIRTFNMYALTISFYVLSDSSNASCITRRDGTVNKVSTLWIPTRIADCLKWIFTRGFSFLLSLEANVRFFYQVRGTR